MIFFTRQSSLPHKNRTKAKKRGPIDLPRWLIMVRHILPNVMRPVLVLATIGLALAIIAEETDIPTIGEPVASNNG